MLYSNHRSVFGDDRAPNSISPRYEGLKPQGIKLTYYVLPEDTTDREAERHSQRRRYGKIDIHGTVKAVLWMAIAICLSIFIGKLGVQR